MSLNPSFFASRRPGRFALAGATVLLAALTACGGGGGDTTAPVPDTPAASLDLSGIAAVGKALAGATITAKCATGTNTATAGADGSFSLRITGGVLPCVLQAVSGTTTLHSVAVAATAGTGRSAVANITPLTELVVAQANGGDAAMLFSSFDAAAQAKVSSSSLAAATTSVQAALVSVVDIAGVNPFTDTLVAATGSTAGNPLDKKLDDLGTKLGAAKLTLAELMSAIVRNGSAAAAVVASQVQPAASHCASLRSGRYMLVDPGAENETDRRRRITVDAAALTVTEPDGTVRHAAAVAGKPCHFTSESGGTNTVVSPAGVLMHHIVPGDGSPARVAVSLPIQKIEPPELAGTWNTVELASGDTTPFAVNSYASVVIDTTGKLTALSDCKFLQPCVAQTGALPNGILTTTGQSTNGGDLYVNGLDGSQARFFAYRAPSGDMMLIGLTNSGVMFGTRQAALALPAVGSTLTYWDASVNAQGVASNLFGDVRTITAVDAAAGTYTRSASFSGTLDSFTINSPRPGLRHRATCVNSSGATVNCGLIALPLTGMGMTVYGSSVQTGQFMGVSVARPAGSTSTGVQSADTPTAGAAALNTLVMTGGETYPLRVSLTIDANGLVNGGAYDFHKLSGTMTPCTYTPSLADVCFGTSADINRSSQNGALGTQGASSPVNLTVGPDTFGYTFTGVVTGTVWSGTWSQAATANSGNVSRSGSFSVNLVITQR